MTSQVALPNFRDKSNYSTTQFQKQKDSETASSKQLIFSILNRNQGPAKETCLFYIDKNQEQLCKASFISQIEIRNSSGKPTSLFYSQKESGTAVQIQPISSIFIERVRNSSVNPTYLFYIYRKSQEQQCKSNLSFLYLQKESGWPAKKTCIRNRNTEQANMIIILINTQTRSMNNNKK